MRKLWLAVVFAGCGMTQSPAQKGAENAGDAVREMNTEPMTEHPPRTPGKSESDATPPPSVPAGKEHTIGRREIDAVLAQSPGYFLQHVETKAQFRGGHFHGWRLIAFFPGDNRFSGIDLQAGDVVTSVNGKPIEQPDQFMAVWTELRSSNQLTVDVERDGTPRTLRWQISEK